MKSRGVKYGAKHSSRAEVSEIETSSHNAARPLGHPDVIIRSYANKEFSNMTLMILEVNYR